ncbi:hypothetical protein [Fretibacter rubidus]|uniref:hypothetical protein n=1 Tax=Fretibacter rubidus TaxID=570162 RepID=UPI003529F46E
MTYFALFVALPFAFVAGTALAQDNDPIDAPIELDAAPAVEQLNRAQRPVSPNSQRMSLVSGGLLFASFDQNGDYQITEAEVKGGITSAFSTADSSGNGSLSLVEVDAWRIRALGSLDLLPGNTQFDRDFNAVVTRAEFTEVLTRNAQRLDRNEDRVLDFSELLQKAPEPQEAKRERNRIFPSRADRQRRR